MGNDILGNITKKANSVKGGCPEPGVFNPAAGGNPLVFDYEPKKDEAKIRVEILDSTLDSANAIYKLVDKEEKSKAKWRTFFILSFSIMLFLSLIFISTMTVLDSIGMVVLSYELVIGVFVNIFADIFSILYFMLKYINNSQYLESFRTTSHKLLDYLVQDKATNGAAKPDANNKTKK